MGMPITVEVLDDPGPGFDNLLQAVFDYFRYVDEKFSTYKDTSEITNINQGLLQESGYSDDMKEVFLLCEETKKLTDGYFDIVKPDGKYDPSGLVKGWSIYNAAKILQDRGVKSFFIEAGGDIQPHGKNQHGKKWKVGIKNPFNMEQIVKVVYLGEEGIATSGTYIRGQHIYDPHRPDARITDVMSLSVIGPDVYEADRFATAAFAMGLHGIHFLEGLKGFEAYMIDKNGLATMTSNFLKYTHESNS